MIEVHEEYDFEHARHVYTVIVPDADLVSINLDRLDRAVLAEPVKTAADILQVLQILAFRQQQQQFELSEADHGTDT